MAKHDRITIRVLNGPDIILIARGAGARVDVQTNREWVTVEELNAGRHPLALREAKVATGSVVSIVRDRVGDHPDDKPAKARRSRRAIDPGPIRTLPVSDGER